MLIIRRSNTDPYFNIAAEEYILKHFKEPTFALWRNDRSIIVGKHQNTLSEINTDFTRENNIPVVRRLSGGGAVFHDLGNLNFTFTQQSEDGNQINFRKYTQPILEVLLRLGVEAKFEGRNDLTIQGKKFSGNAMHIWKNKVLHHGTLLFSAALPDLSEALRADPSKFDDKAVKSVRSRVTNIQEHLPKPMDVLDFERTIEQYVVETNPHARFYDLTPDDLMGIEKLTEEKYRTWNWNFGYSPTYNFSRTLRNDQSGTLEFNLDVREGSIRHIRIYGDFFGVRDSEEIEQALTGVAHREEAIRAALNDFEISEYINHFTLDDLIRALF